MRARISSIASSGGRPTKLRLELRTEGDMPDEILKELLEMVGYRCSWGHGNYPALLVEPHEEVGFSEKWGRDG
jgi:hypothetical protein